MPRRMFEFSERAEDGAVGAFFLRSVPTSVGWRSVPFVMVDETACHLVTKTDRRRWPKAWAAFEQQREHAEMSE